MAGSGNDTHELSGFAMGTQNCSHGVISCRHLIRDSPPSIAEVKHGGAIPLFPHASYWRIA
jgi:hypothetical protein